MKDQTISIPLLALKAGVLICATFIVYFYFMMLLNLINVPELRFLNIFILIIGLFLTFRDYRKRTRILNIDYLSGLTLGVITTVICFFLFAAFVFGYFLFIDPMLLQQLKGNTIMIGNSLSAKAAAATVLVEGVCLGVITSFCIMQYYKSGFYKTVQEKIEAKASE